MLKELTLVQSQEELRKLVCVFVIVGVTELFFLMSDIGGGRVKGSDLCMQNLALLFIQQSCLLCDLFCQILAFTASV